MNVTWGLLTVLSLVCHTESRCSPTSYYKNCWIRRFPGIFIDIEESQRRGAQLLKYYQEDTALKCSRTCCLTRNFSCNLAIFHYDTTQENCFHLHCPTLESCILSHRSNVVLYNITKGVDPDLLVFGKYFTSNVRVLPHHYRGNASDPLPSDKRQFIHPPQPAVLPLTSAPTVKPPTTASRALTTTTTSATLTSTQQSTSQPSTVPTTTVALSSTPETPLASENHAQTITPTTFTTFLTPSLTTPPSSTTAAAFSTYNPTNTPALSTTTEQPSTSNAYYPTTTFSLPATSPPTPTTALTGNLESSKQNLNDTKVNLGRNHTAGSEGQGISAGDTYGELGPGWHVAAHTLLVAVAICVTVLLSCCCSILLVVSWRGQRKRMGRYRTSWRGKRGSMRLIKYVLVRENT
ncbi:MANSC domain-containing protein 4 Precursor [Larimichthys crocea]|uniref:MANSC domain-containing protein 4 n=1 Tax=Larimichthys crocea TaxID=215358 RepID=A0A6G0IX91_LARCR|nr:MANSC domain-containing protein 4 Precursor [Larimichthys crocea]